MSQRNSCFFVFVPLLRIFPHDQESGIRNLWQQVLVHWLGHFSEILLSMPMSSTWRRQIANAHRDCSTICKDSQALESIQCNQVSMKAFWSARGSSLRQMNCHPYLLSAWIASAPAMQNRQSSLKEIDMIAKRIWWTEMSGWLICQSVNGTATISYTNCERKWNEIAVIHQLISLIISYTKWFTRSLRPQLCFCCLMLEAFEACNIL